MSCSRPAARDRGARVAQPMTHEACNARRRCHVAGADGRAPAAAAGQSAWKVCRRRARVASFFSFCVYIQHRTL